MRGLNGEDVRFAAGHDAVWIDVHGLTERRSAGVVGAGVAREVAEVAGGEFKVARVLKNVAEAHVGARGGHRARAKAEAREARRAARGADGPRHVPANAQCRAVGEKRGARRDGAAVGERNAVDDCAGRVLRPRAPG